MDRLSLEFEWATCPKTRVLEFAVVDQRSGSDTWLSFDLDLADGCLVAQHEPLNADQERSELVPFVAIPLNPAFSLDEHLQELHGLCEGAIVASEYYMLPPDPDRFEDKLVPEFWLPYLVNNDPSGLTDEEIAEVDNFLALHSLGFCVRYTGGFWSQKGGCTVCRAWFERNGGSDD